MRDGTQQAASAQPASLSSSESATPAPSQIRFAANDYRFYVCTDSLEFAVLRYHSV
jgi:hypothetical protein